MFEMGRVYSVMPMNSQLEKKLSTEPYVDPTAVVIDSRLGVYTEVGPMTRIQESSIDDYSYIMGNGNVIYSRIGKFCSIASMVRINPGNHPMHRATQHHFTYRCEQFGMGADDPQVFSTRRNRPVEIGHDVWIGHGAIILPGVRIGTGAVIGAGAVVSKDVQPYMVVTGVPGKPIKQRFPDEIQQALLRIQWWDWSYGQLKQSLADFRDLDVETFVAKYDLMDQGLPSKRHT
jgi:phosphonate metabolism protein (transferase hexapeptide repeat family)